MAAVDAQLMRSSYGCIIIIIALYFFVYIQLTIKNSWVHNMEACFFLSSFSSLIKTCIYMYIEGRVTCMYCIKIFFLLPN